MSQYSRQSHRRKMTGSWPSESMALASRSKAAATAFSVAKIAGPDSLWRDYLLDDQLTDFALLRQLDCLRSGIMKQTADLTTIVRVDNTGENVQSLPCGQTGPRSDTPVITFGHSNRQTGSCYYTLAGS